MVKGETGRFLSTPKAITPTSNVQIQVAGINTLGNLSRQTPSTIAAMKAYATKGRKNTVKGL